MTGDPAKEDVVLPLCVKGIVKESNAFLRW